MNYADIKQYDVANGPGVRISLFVSGCSHHCEGCFNPETWDYAYGKPFTEETIETILTYLKPDFIRGITLLGGDPFEKENQAPLIPLLKEIRKRYPEKTVWCYTGYVFEEILAKMEKEWPDMKELLPMIDVLVDGEFILEKKNLDLYFKGSENQRTIMVQESLEQGKMILWQPEE